MSFGWVGLIGSGIVVMSVLMAVVFVLARKLDNYSIVDSAWALSFFLVALLDASAGEGWITRKLLILIPVTAWSLRLGIFLWLRIASHHPKEDGRYQALRSTYAPQVARGFFRFFQIQGLSVVLLSVPFALMCANDSIGLSPIEKAGLCLWLIAFVGEAIADHQMSRFKANPANQGKTCQLGLWRYSRHPNYFFESCVWVSYFLMALASPYGWVSFYCPAIMIFLVTCITGIPPAEAQALKSRGEEYRAYQRRTSAFVPWFPKAGK